MRKSNVLHLLRETAPLKRAQFYLALSPRQRADMDVITLVYPYVLEDTLASVSFNNTITNVYATDADKVIDFLKSGKIDSWIVNYIDPDLLCYEDLYFIAKAAIKADYHFYGFLTPTTTNIISLFKLSSHTGMVVNLLSLFPELVPYQSDVVKSDFVSNSFCMN